MDQNKQILNGNAENMPNRICFGPKLAKVGKGALFEILSGRSLVVHCIPGEQNKKSCNFKASARPDMPWLKYFFTRENE